MLTWFGLAGIGTIVGAYRITGVLGEGGMGAVFRAEHMLIGRAAAIKILRPEWSQNQEVVTRFFNEARAAAAIQHPGIIEVYDFGRDDNGAAYLVMEQLAGESLGSRLARGCMALPAAITVARQIAGALAAAHRIGIVHRDLKPENVFLIADSEVDGGERVKLLDFGIAKLASAGDCNRVTRPGAILGTPTYMAPEQCIGAAVDHRADLYSLGCILFELCTGRPPFIEQGLMAVLTAHVASPPPTMSSLAEGVPAALDRVVERLLDKRPQQRIQTADQVVEALDAARASIQAGADATELVRPPSLLQHRHLILGLGGAVAAVLGFVLLYRPADRRAPRADAVLSAAIASRSAGPVVRMPVELPEQRADVAPVASHEATPGLVVESEAKPLRPATARPHTTSVSLDAFRSVATPPPVEIHAELNVDTPAPPASPGAAIARRYVETGQRLKTLENDRGAQATADLWPLFRRIRLDDAIAVADKREEADALLRRIDGEISARSR